MLKTGAIAQYPLTRSISKSCEVMRFVDGSEQRYPVTGSPLRRWVVRLEQLDEAEMAALDEFFLAHSGELQDFSFTDPWDEAVFPSCRLGEGEFTSQFPSGEYGNATLIICENRS